MLINKIHLKRLKRKKKMGGRIKCHGNKFCCKIEHLNEKIEPKIVEVKKKNWFIKLWEFIKSFIT